MSKKILYFLCTGNSCRSQMAEGFAREYFKDVAEVYSAGLVASGVNPLAIQVMAEENIDIAMQKSNTIDEILLKKADYIITLCDHARENCPIVPTHAKKIHWSLTDPALATGTQEEILGVFRQVRDEIKARLLKLKSEITC